MGLVKKLKDILFEEYHSHPTTHNDMIDGHKVDEVITSVVNETGCPIRLDYVFFLNQENRKECILWIEEIAVPFNSSDSRIH